MSLTDINGVRVNFPFQPYSCQISYMEKVIQCLQQEENGVLESPTGTGKTLCLLCSSLAWLESRKAQVELSRQAGAAAMMADAGKENMNQGALAAMAASLQRATGSVSWGSNDFVVPRIIYASRTHSQLSQAMQELKRTAYNGMKTAVIGSRDQLCINEQVKKEKNNNAKVHICRAKVSARRCHHYNVLEELMRNTEVRQIVGSVADIEDLVSQGTKTKVCPYYMARQLKSDADIIFMPYNYLLDPKTRKSHGIELQGNIVIFDEAHNLEQICEDSASFVLSSVDLATAIEETTQLGVKMTDLVSGEMDVGDTGDGAAMPDFTLEDIIRLKKTLLELEELIDAEPLTAKKEAIRPGIFMFELMAKINITFATKNYVIDLLDKMVSHFNSDGTSSAFHSKGVGLSKVADALKIIFNQEPGEGVSVSLHRQSLAQHYKVHIQLKEGGSHRQKKLDSWASTGAGSGEKGERVLSYWCFSPGYSMQDLKSQGVKSIILTSGTLSPIESFTAEMQIPFNVQLQNPHVIEKHQVWVGTLSRGPDGIQLNSSYHNRFTESYQTSLGNTIVNFTRVVPDGLLVFFPSYPIMEKCVETWQNKGIWDRIVSTKPVVLEPRGKDAFTQAMDDFYEKVKDPKLNGAVFMAVCRGKVSEGLDFADTNGRAVILTGLPFPPLMDPRVVLKMQHLDGLAGRQGFKSLTGQQWYRQQATRAVNQAIGRVIRHKDDFGAIMLCDSRFSSADSINGLPLWVKPHITKYDNFGRAVKDLLSFFKVAEKMLPVPTAVRDRRKVDSSGPGCAGAFFEPTLTRHVAHTEQASSVPCHVPGLGKHSTEDYLGTLKSLYGKTISSGNNGQPKKKLLDALDFTEKDTADTCYSSAPQATADGESVRIHSNKRKKIVIKPNSSTSPETAEPQVGTGNPHQPQRTSAHLSIAESYIAEVKGLLTMADYKRFSQALQEYKKTGCLKSATPVLADLFTASAKHFHLFRKFYRFVRPAHKAEFDQLCVSLTGQSSHYKPEHALSGKRLQSGALVQGEKRSRLDNDGISTSNTLGLWSTGGGSDVSGVTGRSGTQTMLSATFPGRAAAAAADASSPAPITSAADRSTDGSGNSLHHHRDVAAVGSRTSLAVVVDCGTCEGGNKSDSSSQPQQTSVMSTEACNFSIRIEKLQQIAGQVNKVHSKSGYRCCKCNQDAHIPFRHSVCQHVCCLRCWQDVLKGDKICPGGCNQTVRHRYLCQLMFASGSDFDAKDKA